jgi:hypothetical protein
MTRPGDGGSDGPGIHSRNMRKATGWSRRFDDPIVLDDGTKLATLRDAIQYLARTVPKAEQNHEKVLNASDHLTRSAEQGYPLFFARAATALWTFVHARWERFSPIRDQSNTDSLN